MTDPGDLAIRVHANVFIVDRIAIFRERVDDDLADKPVALVVDPGALFVDELDRGFDVLLTLDRAKHAIEQRHVAPLGGVATARSRHSDLHATITVGLVGHHVVGVGLVSPNTESRVGVLGGDVRYSYEDDDAEHNTQGKVSCAHRRGSYGWECKGVLQLRPKHTVGPSGSPGVGSYGGQRLQHSDDTSGSLDQTELQRIERDDRNHKPED